MKARYALGLGAVLLVGLLSLSVPPEAGGQRSDTRRLPGERGPRLRVDVDLVLVQVTVTDPYNRLVTGLEKEHFAVSEDRTEQEILYFSNEDAPLSLGIVLDVSDSMNSSGKMERATKAAVQFLQTANPQDEFFLVRFSDQPDLLTDFTSSIEEVQNQLIYSRAEGRTALFDALYLALDTMRNAHNPRKALLVISDGGDNRSRYGLNDIKAAVRESDVQIYAIAVVDPQDQRYKDELIWGPFLLRDLAEMTGGRSYEVEIYNIHDLPDIAQKISVELRNQYVIGYRPTNRHRDGTWRKIRVKLNPPKGLPQLNIYARSGYYAPSE